MSSMMRYSPRSSVTALRTFSMRTGLDASTVTPGRTAPDASVTMPVMLAALVPCAPAGDDMEVRHATARRPRHGIRYMDCSFPRKRDRRDAGPPNWETSVEGRQHTPRGPGCQRGATVWNGVLPALFHAS